MWNGLFGDTIQKGSVPLAPLDDWGKYPDGSNPRASNGTFPETFYNPPFALILATLRFKEMPRGGSPMSRYSPRDGIYRK